MRLRGPLATFASVVSLAAWLDFSRLQEWHHADSLVPVLAGLTAWTPFYWGQDRYGMLIPLLALPVRDPQAHLLLQGFLTLALSVWGLILVVRTLLPRSVPWWPAAALLLALLLLLPPAEELRFNILWVQPYMLSFGLGLSAVAIVNGGGPTRLEFAAILFLAAAWVNVSLAAVLAPLIVWRALVTDTTRSALARLHLGSINLLFLALATVASLQLSRSAELHPTPTHLVPRAAWAHAASALLRTAASYEKVRTWTGVALGLAAVGLLSLFARPVRRAAGPILSAAGGLILTAAFPFALAATSQWVADNNYSVRYLIPSLVLLQAACCLVASLPALAFPLDRQGILRVLSVGAVSVATLVAVGPPSGTPLAESLERRWGEAARDVIAGGATHVTGDYWTVWPTVFYVDWLLGSPRSEMWPYGMTARSVATLKQALAVPHPRVAVLDSNSMWLGLLGMRGWQIAEHRPTCLILTEP